MQHHAHIVARTAPPHMRGHHMAVPPPQHSQSQTHMPNMNMTHAPPPPPPTGQQQQMPHHHQQQQQQQQAISQHLNNGPVTTGSAAAVVASGATISGHQTRLNQQSLPQRQHQHTQSMHNSTQLQKLRQQHQHINSINNNTSNTNSTNKTSYNHQTSAHQYNSGNKTHGNVLPMHSVLQQQQQQQQQHQQNLHHQSTTHQNSNQNQHQHQQQTIYHNQQQQKQHTQHIRPVTQMAPQQTLGHLQQTTSSQQQSQQQQPQQTTLTSTNNISNVNNPQLTKQQTLTTLSYATASVAQNNNNNNNIHNTKCNISNIGNGNAGSGVGSGSSGGMVPKSILQNPNRVSKTPLQNSTGANKIEGNKENPKRVSIVINDVITVKDAPTVAAVSENKNTAATTVQDNLKNVQSTIQREAAKDANKENVKSEETNINIKNDVSQSNTDNNKSKTNILSNVDNTVSKNSREKTPMCHVNELARFNKITHQYRLTSEKGPAHCKRFTVTLKLGDEEYTAEGFKIKKAQHLAAAEALASTKYKHPVPKVIRRNADGEGHSSRTNITPTVELNALAMKLGQQTYYLLDPRQNIPPDAIGPPPDSMMPPRFGGPPAPHHMLPSHGMGGGGSGGVGGGGHIMGQHPPSHLHMMDPPGYGRRNGPYAGPPPPPPPMHGHSSNGPCMPPRYGHPGQHPHMPKYNTHQRYPLIPPPPHMGVGGLHNSMPPPLPPYSQQSHHHRAPHPRCYGMYSPLTRVTLVVGKQKFVGTGHTLQQAKHDAAGRALQVLKVQATEQQNEELNNSHDENDKKSPISLVHEIAIQRSLTVHFKVLREEGPAHMKKFVTACIVGSIVTEGEGNGKKISKKRSAENMLEELKKLPPLTPTKSPVKRIKGKSSGKAAAGSSDTAATGSGRSGGGGSGNERRKRGSASIKEKVEVDNDAENPITRLTQIQQNRKEKEPVFELIAKNGNENSRRREFIIEVTASGMVARGTGNSKKLAKRNAAQNLLLAMGINANDSVDMNASTDTNNAHIAEQGKTELAIATKSNIAVAECNEQKNTLTQSIADVAPAVPANCRKVPLVSTPAGKVPGILILRQNKKQTARKKECLNSTADDNLIKKPESIVATTEEQNILPTPTVIEKAENKVDTATTQQNVATSEAINNCVTNTTPNSNTTASNTNATTSNNGSSSTSKSVGVHMKDQLLYLAKLMGFEVNFSDYPKGVHSDFLTIVTLSTNPPQICHGMGSSIEESQNDAARNALKILSELGLNNAAK